jgi:hypothetical protein
MTLTGPPGMTGRELLLLPIGGVIAVPRPVRAQQAGHAYPIGWISSSAAGFKEPQALAFVQRQAELGFVEGRTFTIERRHPDNKLERLPAVAAKLGTLRCDAYLGGGGEGNLAALAQAGRATPIVFVAVDFDPVATGDVASLARRGGTC